VNVIVTPAIGWLEASRRRTAGGIATGELTVAD